MALPLAYKVTEADAAASVADQYSAMQQQQTPRAKLRALLKIARGISTRSLSWPNQPDLLFKYNADGFRVVYEHNNVTMSTASAKRIAKRRTPPIVWNAMFDAIRAFAQHLYGKPVENLQQGKVRTLYDNMIKARAQFEGANFTAIPYGATFKIVIVLVPTAGGADADLLPLLCVQLAPDVDARLYLSLHWPVGLEQPQPDYVNPTTRTVYSAGSDGAMLGLIDYTNRLNGLASVSACREDKYPTGAQFLAAKKLSPTQIALPAVMSYMFIVGTAHRKMIIANRNSIRTKLEVVAPTIGFCAMLGDAFRTQYTYSYKMPEPDFLKLEGTRFVMEQLTEVMAYVNDLGQYDDMRDLFDALRKSRLGLAESLVVKKNAKILNDRFDYAINRTPKNAPLVTAKQRFQEWLQPAVIYTLF